MADLLVADVLHQSAQTNHQQGTIFKKNVFPNRFFFKEKMTMQLQKPRVDLVNIKMLHLDELFRDVLFFGFVIFISGIRRTVSRFFRICNHSAALAGGSFLRLQRPLSAFRPCPTRRKIPYRQKEILIHANWNLQAVELAAECIARPILETFLDFTHLFYWVNYPVIFEKSNDFFEGSQIWKTSSCQNVKTALERTEAQFLNKNTVLTKIFSGTARSPPNCGGCFC